MSVELKLRTYTPAEIAGIVGGKLALYGGADGGEAVTGVAIDSREAGAGILFAAIKGERNDGNDFIPQALEAGSSCFLCQFVPDGAAAKAGLQEGDFIVAADGEPLETTNDLLRVRRRYRAGDTLTMEIDRGGERFTAAVVLEEASDQ